VTLASNISYNSKQLSHYSPTRRSVMLVSIYDNTTYGEFPAQFLLYAMLYIAIQHHPAVEWLCWGSRLGCR